MLPITQLSASNFSVLVSTILPHHFFLLLLEYFKEILNILSF